MHHAATCTASTRNWIVGRVGTVHAPIFMRFGDEARVDASAVARRVALLPLELKSRYREDCLTANSGRAGCLNMAATGPGSPVLHETMHCPTVGDLSRSWRLRQPGCNARDVRRREASPAAAMPASEPGLRI